MTTLAGASEGDQKLADLEIGNLAWIGWKVAVVEANDKFYARVKVVQTLTKALEAV